ncbi:MAG: hypothetical protein A3I09_04305 [Deltaproteobacteria bacterium RIFCSPLOWO2_02_FULL_47_10]|nr:MAG: hypothetical protein A3I09_04305 [Deltaproteobacteria bacterium RIFCSPLOWO2_02_FULL_47_10]
MRNFKIRFWIQSSTRYLSFIRQLISTLGPCGVKISKRTAFRCATAMVEAVDNAIFHAHKQDVAKEIGIGIEVCCGRVKMEVKDNGKGFDIEETQSPNLYDSGGRGLFIIKSLTNKMRYENNTLRMWL